MWFSRLDKDLQQRRMKKTAVDPNVYYFCFCPSIIILFFHIDDLFFTGLKQSQISYLKRVLGQKYKMTNLGLMQEFLGNPGPSN